MTTGIGLAEVYDVDPNANAQAANLSARAFVGTGNDVLIWGTIIRGERHKFASCPRACAWSIACKRGSSYPTS
jgi:hypothetical protein